MNTEQWANVFGESAAVELDIRYKRWAEAIEAADKHPSAYALLHTSTFWRRGVTFPFHGASTSSWWPTSALKSKRITGTSKKNYTGVTKS